MLKIAVVHNRYQQAGGEDQAFADECELLRSYGHEVIEYTEDNDKIQGMSRWKLAADTVWARDSAARLSDLLRRARPDIAHFHNIFPLISPSAYYAARRLGIAVVQTLHNYRLVCANALFLREGKICEDCLNRGVAWPAVVHACYRGSGTASLGVATMLGVHEMLGTWRDLVSVYIALSDFAREKFVQGGLPRAKVVVKPNCVIHAPAMGAGASDFVLYAGRLSAEKGIATALAAWEREGPPCPLWIVGDGPEAPRVREVAARCPAVIWLGPRDREFVLSRMREARLLLVPSLCYENFPMVIAEAFAAGLPVLASNIGSLAGIVRDRHTGFHFAPGDAGDLMVKLGWALQHPAELCTMRRAARSEFEERHAPAANYKALMEIYEQAIASSRN